MLGFALPAAILLACATAGIDGTPLEGEDPATATTDASPPSVGADGQSCTGTVPRVDPSSLPSCCTTGAAHCAPGQYVPASDQSQLAPCSGGFCVPDKFIASGDTYVPPACTSLNNAQGVCLSVCIPQVAQYQAILPQDNCDPDERCAPCVNPLTQQSSGACQLGQGSGAGNCTGGAGGDASTPPPPPRQDAAVACPYTGPPLLDPSSLPSCDPSGGAHCLQASLVPPAEAAKLGPCPNNGGLCVPDVFIESDGNFIPKTCTSVAGAEGRCLEEVIPQVAAQSSQLPVDLCQSFERCVLCFSPLDGSDTGACRLSCDPGPTKPAVVFKDCCTPDHASTTDGKCVPIANIPQSQQNDLDTDECANNKELCVPTEILEPGFAPPSCTADNFFVGNYSGVCLSTCLDFGLQNLGISQGSCDNIHECVPCVNPTNGQPTGAPGCAGADAGP
jgi:hypothetical protein